MVDVYFLADAKNLKWCYCCPHAEGKAQLVHANSTSILKRLCLMLIDPDAKKLINRHILLINHYLSISENKFIIFDIPYIGIILEHLSKELNDEICYNNVTDLLLRSIQKPPIIFLSSHNEEYTQHLTNYFTSLAISCYHFNDDEFRFLIVSAINNTLFFNRQSDHFISQEACIRSLENSQIAPIFSLLLETLDCKRTLGNIVDLFNNISLISKDFSISLYNQSYVERILSCFSLFMNDSSQHHNVHKTAFLLLQILESVIALNNTKPLDLSHLALSNLREWFKDEVLHGSKQERNAVLTIILAIVSKQKSLNYNSSHLLEDILLLCLAPQHIKENSWVDDVELTSDPFDFEFKKLLLITTFELFDCFSTEMVAEKLECVAGLSQLFDLNLWSEKENNIITMYSLHLVPRIAKQLPHEMIKYDMLTRMFCRSGKLVNKNDCNEEFFYLIQAIYSISLNNDLIEYFKEKNFISLHIDYAEILLKLPSWTVRVQLVLQYILNSTVSITSKLKRVNIGCSNACPITTLSIDLLKRIAKPEIHDSIFDPCLLISIIDFIWEIQIQNITGKKEFIKAGGIFLILDLLEKEVKKNSMGGAGGVILGLLSDLLDMEIAVLEMVTWKGTKFNHLMNLLCHIWRLIETEKQVNRDDKGCIVDCEAPLMGSLQASSRALPGSCPPLLEMIGCLRPKIYAIFSLLLISHKEIVEITEDAYNSIFRLSTTQDRVTVELIKHYEYLKEGEIWQNMLCLVKSSGAPPVAGDELLLHTLTMEYIKCARNVQHLQKYYLKIQSTKELQEETCLYNKIKASKIMEEVDNYRKIEKDLIIKNTRMRHIIKQQQLASVERNSEEQWKNHTVFKTYNNTATATTLTIGRDIIDTEKN